MKRGYPTVQEPECTPAEMSTLIKQARYLTSLPRVDTKNAEEIKDRITLYFDFCDTNGKKPIVNGLAAALGVTRGALIRWENENTERGQIIRDAKQVIKFILEDCAVSGKLSPPIAIFWAKNFLNMSDQITVTAQTAESAPQPERTKEQIKKMLMEDLPIESEYKEVK